MSALRQMASFARWRLVPVRYASRVMMLRPSSFRRPEPSRLPVSHALEQSGMAAGPTMDADTLAAINAVYRPRIDGGKQPSNSHPFVNLIEDQDLTVDNPLMRLAFSPEVLDLGIDYFGGGAILDSIQVLFSFPTEGELRESQKWHLDYSDTKSLHYIAYLNDVTTEADGPFVCVDREGSRKVGRSMIIRRINDEDFRSELGSDQFEPFYGKAGESLIVDPAACYHYGSRCRTDAGRLAIFITFSSLTPFVGPQPSIMRNRNRLFEIGRALRPDLPVDLLRRLLMLQPNSAG